MSIDMNALIAKPQANVIKPAQTAASDQPLATTKVSSPVPAPVTAPVPQKPAIQEQPKSDAFVPSSQKETPANVLDKLLKYSGVVALVATPVALIVNQKMANKALNTIKDEFASKLSSTVNEVAQKITDATSEMSTKIGDKIGEAANDSKLSETVSEQLKEFAESNQAIKKGMTFVTATLGAMTGFQILGNTLITPSGKQISLDDTKEIELSDQTVNTLNMEASKRVKGQYAWPKLDNVQSWMVSSETESFMKVGGLAEVAVQLPDAFNKKYKDDPNNNIDVVTPLYVRSNSSKIPSVEKIDDKHFVYNSNDGAAQANGKPSDSVGKNRINLELKDSFEVRVYNAKKQKFVDEKVDVLTGEFNGTKYVFFKNDKYFNIDPSPKNNPQCKGCYALSVNNIGETERMAFLSKASYTYMKRIKEGAVKDEKAPTTIIANDWHASAISALMRYEAPVAHDQGKLSDETYDYIKNTPIVHITHNAQVQGSDDQNADAIFRTLFEENTDAINKELKGLGDEFPLSTGLGNFNPAYSDLYLADRSVAVSRNYAEELCKAKDLGCGLETVNNVRKTSGTMLGIVNGYDKRKAEPNEKMAKDLNAQFNPPKPFVAFDNKYNEEGYNLKMQNKEALISFLNSLATSSKATNGEFLGERGKIKLYKPETCAIPENLDLSKVPVLTSVGRFENQKGFDYIAAALTNVLNSSKEGQEKPIVAILGNGDTKVTEALQKFKDDLALKDKEAASRIFLFDGFSTILRNALTMGGDFFMMPSKWEPCGLTQMECMANGNLPIATATGGLPDTIDDGIDGFVTDKFFGYASNELIYDVKKSESGSKATNNIEAYTETLGRALDSYYGSPEKIKEMSIKAMAKDFSWDREGGSMAEYEELLKTGKVTRS